jgi:hypothetical protein
MASFFRREPPCRNTCLRPQGEFPRRWPGPSPGRNFLRFPALRRTADRHHVYLQDDPDGDRRRRAHAQFTEAGALDGDPLLSTVLLFVLFGFFAKFWTWSGQTLGMQVWCIRVQNADGSSISLWQALLRFVVSIASLLCVASGLSGRCSTNRNAAGMTCIPIPNWYGFQRRPNNFPTQKPHSF